MAEIKYQGVAKGFGLLVVRLVKADKFEQLLVQIEGLVEVGLELLPLSGAATNIQAQGFTNSLLNIH